MADPYNSKEVLVELINLTDNFTAEVSDFNFGLPQRATGLNPVRNTSIVLTPKTESGFYGAKTVHYNRIHISEVGTIVVERGAANTHLALLPAINLKYGLYLTEDDVVDQLIPAGQTGEITVNLNINPNSITWYSGDVIITG